MKPEDIQASLANAPAIIHMADGRAILVSHPDAVFLIAPRSTAVICKNDDGEMVNALLPII